MTYEPISLHQHHHMCTLFKVQNEMEKDYGVNKHGGRSWLEPMSEAGVIHTNMIDTVHPHVKMKELIQTWSCDC